MLLENIFLTIKMCTGFLNVCNITIYIYIYVCIYTNLKVHLNCCLRFRDDVVKFFREHIHTYTQVYKSDTLKPNFRAGMRRFFDKAKTYYVLSRMVLLQYCFSSLALVLHQKYLLCYYHTSD